VDAAATETAVPARALATLWQFFLLLSTFAVSVVALATAQSAKEKVSSK